MLAEQTRTAEASGRGAGHFLVLSLRDALKAGELCRIDRLDSPHPERLWYELRFHWTGSEWGEAIRVATNSRGQVLIAETWLLPTVSDEVLFGDIAELRREIESTQSIVALHLVLAGQEQSVAALALESDAGKQLLVAQPGTPMPGKK